MDLNSKIDQIWQDFEEGNINCLDALLLAREVKNEADNIVEAIKKFENNIQEYVETECKDYPDGYKGFKVSVMGGRKSYDWSNVPEVLQIEAQLKAKKKWYETAFKLGGAVKEGDTFFYEGKPLPEIKYGKSFIKVESIKK